MIPLILFLPWLSYAIPRRGNEPWSVVLCKLRDTDYEPRTAEWFREWMTKGNNPDTIESYFSSVSNAIYTIRGSNVTEWLRLPWTRREVHMMALRDPRLQTERERPFALYDKAKQLCISFAEQSGYQVHKQRITVINSEQTAVYGKDTGVLLTPKLIFSSVLAHEMIHSMNIGHSYSDRPKRIFPYSALGEYDDHYDLMSTANAFMRPSTYGLSGPGLNGPHLDYLGWLPMNRVLYFGRDGRTNYTLRLSSLSVPHRHTNGWLLVQIPYDRDDARNVYTVEYRTPVGNDAAIRQGGIVIHRIHRVGLSYYSTLVTHALNEFDELTEDTEWIQFISNGLNNAFEYIRVKVGRINYKKHSADIHIVTTFSPDKCHDDDIQISLEDYQHLETKGVPFVCLDSNRSITQEDIEIQHKRDLFFELRRTFGQNECKEGREWRAIDSYDYVCVPPSRATEAQNNAVTFDTGGKGCGDGLVHRLAFQGDTGCVSKEERTQIHRENTESHKYYNNYAFFNGADPIGP